MFGHYLSSKEHEEFINAKLEKYNELREELKSKLVNLLKNFDETTRNFYTDKFKLPTVKTLEETSEQTLGETPEDEGKTGVEKIEKSKDIISSYSYALYTLITVQVSKEDKLNHIHFEEAVALALYLQKYATHYCIDALTGLATFLLHQQRSCADLNRALELITKADEIARMNPRFCGWATTSARNDVRHEINCQFRMRKHPQ